MGYPLVDIVLATNRAGSYLAATLESVRCQTYAHWRLIVVDDGTPDAHAVERALEGMPHCTVIRQECQGPAAARNRGIAAGEAPLIAFLDDDDVWEPDKLEAQVAALAEMPDAVASFSAGRYIDGFGREFGHGWEAANVPSRQYVSGEVPAPRIVSLMVKREAHVAIGGLNETYRMAEDNEYILRLAIYGSMVAVPRVLVSYRRHGGNISEADSIEGRRANRRLLHELMVSNRENLEIATLLAAHRSRWETAAAGECVRALGASLRRRDVHRICQELAWAVTAPLKVGKSLLWSLLLRA